MKDIKGMVAALVSGRAVTVHCESGREFEPKTTYKVDLRLRESADGDGELVDQVGEVFVAWDEIESWELGPMAFELEALVSDNDPLKRAAVHFCGDPPPEAAGKRFLVKFVEIKL